MNVRYYRYLFRGHVDLMVLKEEERKKELDRRWSYHCRGDGRAEAEAEAGNQRLC